MAGGRKRTGLKCRYFYFTFTLYPFGGTTGVENISDIHNSKFTFKISSDF